MPRRSSIRRNQQGYILITLIFFAAVLAIVAAAALPRIVQEVKRDREEELVHRGVQYTRAIRLYYKKFGRYPSKIEELESTNNLRFLRRRYKDPFNVDANGAEQDFKFLRYGDLPPNMAATLNAGAPGIPGAAMANAQGIAALNPAAAQAFAAAAAGQQSPTPTPAGNSSGDETNAGNLTNPANPATGTLTPASSPGAPGTNPNAAVFGGGGILGVVSVNKSKSIHEFNKKNHYNDWLFIYAPSLDRGGLLTTPYQTPGSNLLQQTQTPGAPSQPPRTESTE